MTGVSRSRPARHAVIRTLAMFLAASASALPVAAQTAPATEIKGEAMTLSYSYHHFDGVEVDTVVLTSRSLQLMTDTFGIWTPLGEGTTSDGFVLKHRQRDGLRLTLRPFVGPGPGRSDDDWSNYRTAVAARLGPETKVQDAGKSGTVGSVPSFGSWETREACFETPQPDGSSRAERHIVADDGQRGIQIILSGRTADVNAVDQDLRLFLARLERQDTVRTARNN